MVKYLNLGCGNSYSTSPEWTNLDFISGSKHIIAHNLLKGIPFEDNTFDLVYHSHVLEHFEKDDGEKLINECFRTLQPNGAIRIAVPDLERIAREYIHNFESGLKNPEDQQIAANYDWVLIELFDQMLRNKRGGQMGRYLEQDTIINEDYITDRIGSEGTEYRKNYLERKKEGRPIRIVSNSIAYKLKQFIKEKMYHLLKIDTKALKIGQFRLSGEIHQWMYDRYSLSRLLAKAGFKEIVVRNAFESYIKNWAAYGLDGKAEVVRKPESLFIEALKP